MARKIVWSKDALDDLEKIADYIARDSRANAAKVIKKILAATRNLNQFPHLGLVVPEISDPQTRQRIVLNYRLIYRLEPDSVLVIAVVHSRRHLGKLLDRNDD